MLLVRQDFNLYLYFSQHSAFVIVNLVFFNVGLVFKPLAKIGGFAAIFARSASHQTKAVALNMLTLKVQSHLILNPQNLH